MERHAGSFENLTPAQVETEIAEAYVMGAVDHSVIVDFEKLVEGASRETAVSMQTARDSVSHLADSGKIVFDSEKGIIGRHGIPQRAERSTDDSGKQVETASNLYYALVENGDTVYEVEAVDHAVFSAGVTWQSAQVAMWSMRRRQELEYSLDGKISKFQKAPTEK